MNYCWHFYTKRPADKERNPIQGEYFAAEAIDKPGEALIREGIQNSLDARRNGEEKVMVRIRVSGEEDALPRDTVEPFLEGLEPHLRAPGNGLREIPDDNEPCPFLVFEDFGTTGLTGEPKASHLPENSTNRFYHFFRAEGRSDKGKKDIGRWGVGKQVFLRASKINTLFALTVREDDHRALLMGMAVLKTHDLNGKPYMPDGWFGRPPQSDNDLVLPIEDRNFIDLFTKTFDIQREIHRSNDPGLSIVVPWCDLELTDQALVEAVLRGYFWPILRGRLEVIVETRGIETVLDAESLEGEIRKIGGSLEEEILPLVKLAKWAMDLQETEYVSLKHPGSAWQLKPELFPDDFLHHLRERYERGEKIAIRVPVTIREKRQPDQSPGSTYFDVFLIRDGSDRRGKPVFIRGGIIIPSVRRYGSHILRGVRSLVIAEDDPIAAFLGDAENPAHTEWQENGTNFKGKYEKGREILKLVKNSAIEIVRILNEQDKKEDRTLLSDFFSIIAPPGQQDIRRREKKTTEDKGTEPERVIPPKSYPKPFFIDRVDGGFVVRNSDTSSDPPPKVLVIRAAYHVRRGNPFTKYHPADFDFSQQMKKNLTGATILEEEKNKLLVEIHNKNFRIEVKGFDPKRDVRVEVTPREGKDVGSDT